MASKFYVVWQGRETGIFNDWATCKKQIDKFAGARYKSFKTQAEAQTAFSGGASSSGGNAAPAKRRNNGQTVKTYSAKEINAMSVDTKIFTDGGCDPNPGRAGSGVAIYRNDSIAELRYGLYNPMGTNNTAELNGLHQALLIAQQELAQDLSVAIFCDSKYSIQCITQWAIGWQKKGWKKPGGEIKNLKLIQASFALHQQLKDKIQVLHVNGHVGVEGNELADRMSILAIQQRQSDFSQYSKPIDVKAILAMRAG